MQAADRNDSQAGEMLALDGRIAGMRISEILLYAAVVTTFSMLVRGYYFGISNHIEQLPMVFRRLDKLFCTNDFFVNASESFGPRTYFLHLVAGLSSFLPVNAVYLVLTWLTNTAVCLITYFVALDFFRKSHLTAMIACTLVMGTIGTTPGMTGDITTNMLLPGGFVRPIALLSLWAGLRGRSIVCAVLASLATVIHPLVGFGTGGIGLAASGLAALLR